MRTTTSTALLWAILPAALANPLRARIPTETAELTFFTTSAPACSKEKATYQTLHYVFTSLDKCRKLEYDLGSPFSNLEFTELSPDFANLGAQVSLYESKDCSGDPVGRKTLDGNVKTDKCYGIKSARSVKVTIADKKEIGFGTDDTKTSTESNVKPESLEGIFMPTGTVPPRDPEAEQNEPATRIEEEGVPGHNAPAPASDVTARAVKKPKKKVDCGPVNSNCNAIANKESNDGN